MEKLIYPDKDYVKNKFLRYFYLSLFYPITLYLLFFIGSAMFLLYNNYSINMNNLKIASLYSFDDYLFLQISLLILEIIIWVICNNQINKKAIYIKLTEEGLSFYFGCIRKTINISWDEYENNKKLPIYGVFNKNYILQEIKEYRNKL